MTIDAGTIESAVQQWVVRGSGLEDSAVIFAGQGGPPPRANGQLHDTWIVIAFPSIRRHGMDWTRIEDNLLELEDLPVVAHSTTDELVTVAHELATGTGPVRVETTGVVPAGLEVDRDYWTIRVDDDTLQLAASFLDAMNGVAIAIDDAGTGEHVVVSTPTTTAQGEEIRHRAVGMRTVLVQLTCFSYEPLGAAAAQNVLERVVSSMALPSVRALFEDANLGEGVIGNVTTVGGSPGAAANLEPRAIVEIWLHTTSDVSELGTFIERASGTGTLDDEETPFVVEP